MFSKLFIFAIIQDLLYSLKTITIFPNLKTFYQDKIHPIKFTHSNWTVCWNPQQSRLNIFHRLRRVLWQKFSIHSFCLLQDQANTDLLSKIIDSLCLEFHIKEITQYVSFVPVKFQISQVIEGLCKNFQSFSLCALFWIVIIGVFKYFFFQFQMLFNTMQYIFNFRCYSF